MRRITLWALSTLSAVVLLFGYHTSTSGVTGVSGTTPAQKGSFSSNGSSNGSSTGSGTSAGSGSGGDDESTTPSTSSGTTTVDGSVAQTRWGPVQVQLTVKAGKITKASVLQYPNGNGPDIEINNQALPVLTQETVDAQSAKIDMVSGATVTSTGYLESLQSALDKAGL